MAYKIVVRPKSLEEGALEDYYNQLARKQYGDKIAHRQLGIGEPPSRVPSAQDRVAAYEKSKEEKEKREREKQAAEMEKQRIKGEKEAERTARINATSQQKAANQAEKNKIAAAKKELNYLHNSTQEMVSSTGLSVYVLQSAAQSITNKYLGAGVLAEQTTDQTIAPPQAPEGAKIFAKYYPSTIDAKIFSGFQTLQQVMNFLFIYEGMLGQVQDRVKSLTNGKQFKVDPRLRRVFELNNDYIDNSTAMKTT